MKFRAIILVVVFVLIGESAFSQKSNYPLYGYFFYTIAKNVEWPDQYKSGDFIIGVIGESEATQHLKLMAMKKDIAGRPIKIVEFESISDVKFCHMLLLPKDLSSQIGAVLKKVSGKSVLLITEKEGMALKGSCVNFVVNREGKLGFEMNKNALEKEKLKTSSELSRFAIIL
ncbi:MAG: YfiR family protein [Cyclobacteriaceae bacterium]|nr:YfiR family protein [Cyclobacteriaceae bacterium]